METGFGVKAKVWEWRLNSAFVCRHGEHKVASKQNQWPLLPPVRVHWEYERSNLLHLIVRLQQRKLSHSRSQCLCCCTKQHSHKLHETCSIPPLPISFSCYLSSYFRHAERDQPFDTPQSSSWPWLWACGLWTQGTSHLCGHNGSLENKLIFYTTVMTSGNLVDPEAEHRLRRVEPGLVNGNSLCTRRTKTREHETLQSLGIVPCK